MRYKRVYKVIFCVVCLIFFDAQFQYPILDDIFRSVFCILFVYVWLSFELCFVFSNIYD